MSKIVAGCIVTAVVAIGLIPVTPAQWDVWRAPWIIGAGLAVGVAISLLVVRPTTPEGR